VGVSVRVSVSEHQRSWSVSLKAWERTRKWRMELGKRERCGTGKAGASEEQNQCQYRSVPIPRQVDYTVSGTSVGFKPSFSDRITNYESALQSIRLRFKDLMTKEYLGVYR
jgi:hypothetical protein